MHQVQVHSFCSMTLIVTTLPLGGDAQPGEEYQ